MREKFFKMPFRNGLFLTCDHLKKWRVLKNVRDRVRCDYVAKWQLIV